MWDPFLFWALTNLDLNPIHEFKIESWFFRIANLSMILVICLNVESKGMILYHSCFGGLVLLGSTQIGPPSDYGPRS